MISLRSRMTGRDRGLWDTLGLLVERDSRSPIIDELEDWLDEVITSTSWHVGKKSSQLLKKPTAENCKMRKNNKKKTKVKADPNEDSKNRISHPRVCTRVEQLMGSNLVRINDRAFMRKLNERIQEDYIKQQDARMSQRMNEEIEREKRLVLEGKMRVEEASQELMDHPVFKASQLTKKLIEKRRAIKTGAAEPWTAYYGADEDQEEAVGADEAAAVRARDRRIRIVMEEMDEDARVKRSLLQKVGDITDEYMLSQQDAERLKYESPLVKRLKELQSVEEMYEMAEKIVGSFNTMVLGHSQLDAT